MTPRTILQWTAAIFFASAAFHFGVWILDGMPSLAGPVSWRKPMTFGLSSGLLSFTLAHVLGLMRPTRGLVRQAWLFSILLVTEVALIDLQQWRGVASHFNSATPLDGAIFNTMGALISSVAVLIIVWTRASFGPLATTRAYAWAIRAGMILLNLGNFVGVYMAATQATGLKPVHGAMLHAIQAFPIAVWLVSRLIYPQIWVGGGHLLRPR